MKTLGGIILKSRLKLLRKTLGLNQQSFSKRIGVSPSAISRLETGDINFTEQMTRSICREFNVNYMWFTTGEGEMFFESNNTYIELIDQIMMGEEEFPKQIFKLFTKFDQEDWKALERMLNKFIEIQKETES